MFDEYICAVTELPCCGCSFYCEHRKSNLKQREMNNFQHGDNVKINSRVYSYKWEGWKELWDKYEHHNLIVDRVINLTDTDNGKYLVVVGYPYAHCNKSMIRADYLDNLSRF